MTSEIIGSLTDVTCQGDMPRDYPDNVRKQNFLSEIYGKERTVQLGNYFKTAEEIRAHPDNQGEPTKSRQYDVYRRRIEAASCPRPSEALVKLQEKLKDEPSNNRVNDDFTLVSSPTVQSTSSVVALPALVHSARDVQVMVEPDAKTRRQIYSEDGRASYLKSRHRRRPESRYAFPVISSWEYGWRLSDVTPVDELRNPSHGRCRIIADTFYRSNGLPQLG